MRNYVALSLETHLFFARIMKEHGLFLEAGFLCKDKEWIKKADWFRKNFEELLCDTVEVSNGRISRSVLDAGELVTEFTIAAENRTEKLSGVDINSNISKETKELQPFGNVRDNRNILRIVHGLNRRALQLLNGFIEFKESILAEVGKCRLYQANYPLLIEHILREAKLYRATVRKLMEGRDLSYQCIRDTEVFWNQIMMEHALFIRGLLDPSEEALIKTADDFAKEYKNLLEQAKRQDCRANELTKEILNETIKYSEFKAAGAKGILDCKILSVILPLLADHVLREANHYIRILTETSVAFSN